MNVASIHQTQAEHPQAKSLTFASLSVVVVASLARVIVIVPFASLASLSALAS
jgi:hypothetical protein